MTSTTRLSWAVVTVLALTACSGGGGDASPSPSATASSTPSPTPSVTVVAEPTPSPSPSVSVDPHPDTDELIISTSGLGPLTVGNYPPEDNPGAAMIQWDDDHCPSDPGETGRWVPDGYTDSDVDLAGNTVTPFSVGADGAAVHRIDIWGLEPRTAEGIGIGSPLADLQAAYGPGLVGPFGEGPTQVWILSGGDGSIAFETAAPQPGYTDHLLDPGDPETVLFIRVLHPEQPPDFTVYGSENFAGGCPL